MQLIATTLRYDLAINPLERTEDRRARFASHVAYWGQSVLPAEQYQQLQNMGLSMEEQLEFICAYMAMVSQDDAE